VGSPRCSGSGEGSRQARRDRQSLPPASVMVTATSGGVQHEHREDATGARDNGVIRDGLIAQLALDRFEKRWVASALRPAERSGDVIPERHEPVHRGGPPSRLRSGSVDSLLGLRAEFAR